MNRKHIIRNLRLKGIPFDENLSTKELDNLLNGPDAQNRVCKKFSFANGKGRIQVAFNSTKDDEPAQIMICEDIGKDAWTGEGISLADIQTTLDAITPKTRPLNFMIDSPGGSFNTGCAIHNVLSQWPGVINKTVIGVAASTASWMIPADKTFAYKNSQIFMHRAMCYASGNVDDMQKAIDFLNQTDGQIAQMYADQSGNEPAEMLDMMTNETLLTGQQAKDCGMVDELIDGEATNNFSVEWLNSAKKKLSALNSLSALPTQGEHQTNNQPNKMKKEQKIALLNSRGITVPADADEPKLDSLISASNLARNLNIDILNAWKVSFNVNATDDEIKNLVLNGKPAAATNVVGLSAEDKALMDGMRNQISNARRKDIREAVNKAASEGRITVTEIENWENDAFTAVDHPTNGNPVLNRLNKLEAKLPGAPAIPESVNKLSVESADFKDISKGFLAHNEATAAWKRGNDVPMQEIANASKARAMFTKKFRNRFIEMMNTNTVPAALQQQFIMQDVVIRDFARRIMQLGMFSTVFRNVPLLGKDTVEVQYYDLDATASQAYAGSYDALVSDSIGSSREITVGWGPAKDGAIGKGYARLVQALSFTSQEFARQPYLNIAQRAALKAEKLAFDIFQDVLSVVKVANYPALLAAGNKITKSFDQFSSDDLADLKVACKAWPTVGRGLMLDSAYDGNLLKDPTFKSAYQIALDSVKAEGKLMPKMYGFDYTENPNIPDNGINLRGLAFWKSAILVAFAPVPPVEEVRRAGTNYEIYTDADSDATLETRSYGSNSSDTAVYALESNYGYAPGLKTAIKPIVSP